MMVLIRETWTRAMLWRYAYRNIYLLKHIYLLNIHTKVIVVLYIKYEGIKPWYCTNEGTNQGTVLCEGTLLVPWYEGILNFIRVSHLFIDN